MIVVLKNKIFHFNQIRKSKSLIKKVFYRVSGNYYTNIRYFIPKIPVPFRSFITHFWKRLRMLLLLFICCYYATIRVYNSCKTNVMFTFEGGLGTSTQAPTFGTQTAPTGSLFGTSAFGQSFQFNSPTSSFQLQKPPIGNKRGKQWWNINKKNC